jgi:hypothetical protein
MAAMRRSRRTVLLVSLASVVVAAGTAVLVVGHLRPHPLPPMAETTFAGSATGTPLPFRVTAPGSCPAFSFGAPVEPGGQGPGSVVLSAPKAPPVMLSVMCMPDGQHGGLALDDLVDGLRRHPKNADLVSDPVVEHGPLGAAVRTQEHLSRLMLTEWRVERDGTVVTVGYLRTAGDESHAADVEAMLASWTWG